MANSGKHVTIFCQVLVVLTVLLAIYMAENNLPHCKLYLLLTFFFHLTWRLTHMANLALLIIIP